MAELTVSVYVVAAICGNFWQESGINPGIWEGLKQKTFSSLNAGYGLGQWTNTGGDRRGRLFKLSTYLSDHGYAYDDGTGQLEFLLEENTWYSADEAADFSSLTEFLESDSTDLAYLTHAFNRGWEGIHDASWDARVEYAETVLEYLLEHGEDEPGEWISGNRFLSVDERLHNAVLVYQSLNGYISPTKSKQNMPVYMMIRYF